MQYAANGKEIIAIHPDNTTSHYGDADNADAANSIVTALNAMEAGKEPAFDYVAEAHQTLSPNFYGESVKYQEFVHILRECVSDLDKLDKMKKALFYGEPYNHIYPEHFTSRSNCDVVIDDLTCDTDLSESVAINLVHGIVGIATEAGEMLEALLNGITCKPFDLVNLTEEIGDAKWYMAVLSRVAGFQWGQDEVINIEKLRARFPEKFTEYDANNRNLSGEREILSQGLKISR